MPSVEDGRLFPYFSMSDASVLAGGHRICYNFGMKSSFKIALAFVAAAWAAAADVVSFPGCPWRETKTVARGDAVRVVDAAGRTLLVFNTEGGAFGRHLVVSQAVDHLVVDARAAFKAGMRKLVFTSANFDPKPYRGRDCTLFIAALFMAYDPIKRLASLYGGIQGAVAACERTFFLLDFANK